ncbi:hypothetical protein MLD38_011082 [Melastoma candidum]|uniref:Uncharacterized protein n=1 Tax=Melastoma candidum TaxID=119954 RepID=A0ACB9R1E9_9MYRT|nr:hypothetical protein MLD38_011082 [Melastoma candidum]
MDCSICTSFPLPIRPPRNSICQACHEGITTSMSFIESKTNTRLDDATANYDHPTARTRKGAARLPDLLKRMKDSEEELTERIDFLASSVTAFRDQMHSDIRIKAGDGPPISAHRAILASRSEVFRNMLDSDSCKSPPDDKDAVMIPELTHEELESLMEFLYRGSLPLEKLEKHVYPLSLAGDKYAIPYLQKLCERHMLCSLSASNALDVLEVSATCSNEKLKEAAMEFLVRNVKEIAFTANFEVFCRRNPHLAVQITRACLTNL